MKTALLNGRPCASAPWILALLACLVPAALAASGLTTAPESVVEAPPVPSGLRIDEPTPSRAPASPALAVLPDGRHVAAWLEGGVRLRLLDAGLRPLGQERRADSAGELEALGFRQVAATAGPDGTVLVAWSSVDGVHVRTFEPGDGSLGPEILLSDSDFFGGIALTAAPEASFALVGAARDGLRLLRFEADGTVQADATLVAVADGRESLLLPTVAIEEANRIVVAWNRQVGGFPFPFSEVRWARFRLDGSPVPEGVQNAEPGSRPSLVSLPGGGSALAWLDFLQVRLQRFAADGSAVGDPLLVRELRSGEGSLTGPSPPALAARSDGSLVVVWQEVVAGDDGGRRLLFRRISPSGEVSGPPRLLAHPTPPNEDQGSPALAMVPPPPGQDGELGPDGVAALWSESRTVDQGDPPAREGGVFGRLLPAPLDLAGRFRVEVTWRDGRSGDRGAGFPGPRTRDTGSFWFFQPDNLELVVKALDGGSVNGHVWIFAASLTDLAFRLQVTDLLSGTTRAWENPAGELASFADTEAFDLGIPVEGLAAPLEVPPGLGPMISGSETASRFPPAAGPEHRWVPGYTFGVAHSAAGPCSHPSLPIVPRPGLCLADRRFEVEVEWRDPRSGDSGVGRPIPVTDQTGAFWFFQKDNVELVVKVLDGRALNGAFWVIYGSITDVEFTMSVRHGVTGDLLEIEKPPLVFESGADITTLKAPECECPPTPGAPVCGFDGRIYDGDCSALCRGWVGVDPSGEACF